MRKVGIYDLTIQSSFLQLFEKETLKEQIEITSQNHSFAIDPDSLNNRDVEISHLNLNDRTVAGVKHKSLPIFSVQYHPEASPGPHDADYLFEQFVQAMKKTRQTITA